MVYEKRRRHACCFGLNAKKTDMSVGRLLSISVLIVFVLGPVSLDRDVRGRVIKIVPWWAESQAASPRGAKGQSSMAPGTEGGPAGSRLTPREVRQLLASHNRARTEVGLSPLTWSTKLAVYAQEWADHLASTSRRMEHRPHSGRWKQEHGENLFMGTAGYYGVADAVAMWEGEKRVYDGRAVDQYGVHSFGHYTQLIWRGTRDVGCAKVFCSGYMIVVCNYNPPGNVLGMRPY